MVGVSGHDYLLQFFCAKLIIPHHRCNYWHADITNEKPLGNLERLDMVLSLLDYARKVGFARDKRLFANAALAFQTRLSV